jgi:hypothetical protein
MSLRFTFFGIGSIAFYALLGCSESEPNTSTGFGGGGSGTAGTPSGGSSTSGATSGGAGGSASGATSGGTMSAGSAGMPGGAGGGGGMPGGSGGGGSGGSGGQDTSTSFFVTSNTSETGNLGGLDGADSRCNQLAVAAGLGARNFAAYLSTSNADAKDRIGNGPWYNAKGMLVAQDVATLHAMTGNPDLFIDEKGMKINGQWAGSPTPNEHDILTGSNADGTSSGKTCMDWTSDSANESKTVGHSDGLGPNMDMTAPRNSWNSAHDTEGCDDTAPGGGAGRIYCFATN